MLELVLSAILFLQQPTPTKAEDAQLQLILRDARSSQQAVRSAAYDGLLKRGEEGKKLLVSLLREAEDKAAKDVAALPRSSEAQAFRSWQKKEIAAAREAALAIIRDPKLYPDDAHGAVGQPLVNEKVARLRELWLHPTFQFTQRVSSANACLDRVAEIDEWLTRIGELPKRFATREAAMLSLDPELDGFSLMYDKAKQRDLDDIEEENATGPSAATDEERRFAKILNDYRVMLGLQPVRLIDPLVIAARKHSQEMQDLDYFAHESPVTENRTPSDRARREGHTGPVLENCAVSDDAMDAFRGWYTSSGHHRGLISESAQVLGIGQSIAKDGSGGRDWTMMAGPGNAPKAKNAKPSPRELLASRKKKLKPKDVDTRFALAKFCQKNGLADDAKVLLEEIVSIDPDNKTAHAMLGHMNVGGKWMSAEERLEVELASRPKDEVIASAGSLLNDDDSFSRVAALKVLARTNDPRAIVVVAKALKDKASEVRLAACNALGALTAKDQIPALKLLLADASFYVAHAAAVVLFNLGDHSGVATLFASLRSPDLNHRIDAHKQARALFGQDFGYAWDLPETERAKVVDQWENWVKEQFAH